jgi:hypothetical protein
MIKPLDIPPEVARKVMADMRAYYAEPDGHKADAIVAEAIARVERYMPQRAKRLRQSDMKELFRLMKEGER